MTDNVLSYIEMCQRERTSSLQQGMNFRRGGTYSIILMSVRPGAPYRDKLDDSGTTLIYEGHDIPRSNTVLDPKALDQPLYLPSGRPTQNGKFFEAAIAAKEGKRRPERVRVYEKIRTGIWAYNGVFHLVDAWLEPDALRTVCRFKLVAVEEDDSAHPIDQVFERRRIIPSHVKLEVWVRDGGKCAICGSADELHFDHILPFSKGATSLTAANVQLLCARHNLAKRDRIE